MKSISKGMVEDDCGIYSINVVFRWFAFNGGLIVVNNDLIRKFLVRHNDADYPFRDSYLLVGDDARVALKCWPRSRDE
jgi:hypothetical protein